MAALAITVASVATTDNSLIRRGIASTAITAGMTLYERSTTAGRYGRAFAGTTATAHSDERTCKGISLHAAAVGQPIAFIGSGSITLSASTLRKGAPVFVSTAAGGIDYSTARSAATFRLALGVMRSTTLLDIQILNSTAISTA